MKSGCDRGRSTATAGRVAGVFGLLAAAVLCVLAVARVAAAQPEESSSSAAKSVQAATAVGVTTAPESKVLLAVGAALEASAGNGESSGHGWAVMRLPSQRVSGDSWSLVHLPPRGQGSGGKPGTVRRVVELVRPPEALAADGARVFFFFAPEPGGPFAAPAGQSRMHRRVSMMEAARIDVSPTVFGWEYRPVGGPEAVSSLPGDGELIAAAGGGGQLIAMLSGENGPELFALVGSRWLRIDLPSSMAGRAPSSRAAWTVVGTARGVVLSFAGQRAMRLVDVDAAASTPGSEAQGGSGAGTATISDGVAKWEDAGLGTLPTTAGPYERVSIVDGQIVRTRVEPGPGGGRGAVRMAVVRSGVAGEVDLSPVDGVGLPVAVVPMDGAGRVVVMWSPPTGGATAAGGVGDDAATESGRVEGVIAPSGRADASGRGLQVREVSVHSGRADLYEGTSRREGPITQREFFALSAILAVMIVAVLLFVLRSESRQTFWLPRGMAIAPLSVRVNGALIDVIPGTLVACLAFGTTPLGILGLRPGGMSEDGLWPLFTMLTVTMAVNALLEWRTGRSLGKFVTGGLVVTAVVKGGDKAASTSARGDGDAHVTDEGEDAAADGAGGEIADGDGYEPVGLLRSVVRNVFKWTPPFGLVMFFDANGRHVGDVLTRSAVVVDAPEPQSGGGAVGGGRDGEDRG